MADKNNRAILHSNHPLGCGDVIGQRGQWILDCGYMQTFGLK
jgi:hypothetical protein